MAKTKHGYRNGTYPNGNGFTPSIGSLQNLSALRGQLETKEQREEQEKQHRDFVSGLVEDFGLEDAAYRFLREIPEEREVEYSGIVLKRMIEPNCEAYEERDKNTEYVLTGFCIAGPDTDTSDFDGTLYLTLAKTDANGILIRYIIYKDGQIITDKEKEIPVKRTDRMKNYSPVSESLVNQAGGILITTYEDPDYMNEMLQKFYHMNGGDGYRAVQIAYAQIMYNPSLPERLRGVVEELSSIRETKGEVRVYDRQSRNFVPLSA